MRPLNAIIIYLILSLLLKCVAKGPIYKNLPKAEPIGIEGRYRFPLKKGMYYKNLAGEVVFERNTSTSSPKTYFKILSVGQNKNGAIRQNTYEGLAYLLDKETLELRSERCYKHGKKYWEDRLEPLERWDCDHLFFTFKSRTNFTKREVLERFKSTRTLSSDWLKLKSLIPMPLPLNKGSIKKPVYFSGQLLPLDDNKDEEPLAIVWGYRAANLLRDKQILTVQNENGRDVGKIMVISRPGDFIICKWIGSKIIKEATVAYTNTPYWKFASNSK